MPSLPTVLAPAFERMTRHLVAEVVSTEQLSPNIVKLVAASNDTSSRLQPGTHFGVRVHEGDFRHYTVFDCVDGELHLLIDLHGGGPGARWVSSRRAGDKLQLLAPGGAMRHADAQYPLLAGDVTALATISALATKHGDTLTVVEAHPADIEAIGELLSAGTEVIPTGEQPGDALSEWLSDSLATAPPIDWAYLAGHAQSIQRWRRVVRETGLDRRRISTQAYWASGRAGL